MVTLASFDNLPHGEKLAYIHAHRSDFVGRLLIGVLSTGIYCLPSCTARQPKAENIRYFRTQEEAQAAGLRACLRCRPDYFYRNYDPDLERLNTLVDTIRREPAKIAGLEDMADASGVGVTKLHALFQQHYHTTPAAYLSRARIAAACQMLADTTRQVIDVAYAAGYTSLSTFHDNFRKATGLSPREYQHLDTSFEIALPENYLSWITLKLLESLIERVDDNCAVKALNVGGQTALLHMEWHENFVHCRVESAAPLNTAAMHQIHNAVIRMLGFPINPAGFERLVKGNPNTARIIAGRYGLRIPMSADIFEGITWAIIGQQVNLAFAYKLRRALTELAGQPAGHGLMAHPTPGAVAQLDYADLTQRQYSRRKAEYLIDTAQLIVSGKLVLDPLAAASQTEKQLLAVRGLGPWSVNYIMLRALGFADCVPFGDTGLTTALQNFYKLDHRPDADETAELMKPFAPYRSLATYHLWLSLGANPV
jgi:AraC family transcriptional regulator, regulatory protein of adaptative response / DNA-3-methyladenine glycosylase II